MSSYDLAASCSTTLYVDLNHFKDFVCSVSSFLLPPLLGGFFLVWGSRFEVGRFCAGFVVFFVVFLGYFQRETVGAHTQQ